MKRPSRARRESATTTLKNGRFLAPPRAKRITTMLFCRRKTKGRDFTPVFAPEAMSAAATAGGPERLPPSAPPRQNRRFPGEEIQVEHAAQCIEAAIEERFGSRIPVGRELAGLDELQRIVEHRSHRRYSERTVEPPLLRLLLACALSAPSKSDLQQADIVHVADRE